MAQLIEVTTTTGDREVAERIATELVDRRLAACVQIDGPIQSTYRWRGKIERADEWRCAIKTAENHFGAIEQLLAELHPYDVPELIATPLVAVGAAYEAWLRGELG